MGINGESIWIDVEQVNPGVAETPKAILFSTEDGEKWIPKSQMGGRKTNDDGHIVRVEVSKWWARKEGLLDDKDVR